MRDNQETVMIELIRSNEPALISYVTALLRGAGIEALCLDAHTSAIEGSIGAIPRRLVVADAEGPRARRVLAEAGIEVIADVR